MKKIISHTLPSNLGFSFLFVFLNLTTASASDPGNYNERCRPEGDPLKPPVNASACNVVNSVLDQSQSCGSYAEQPGTEALCHAIKRLYDGGACLDFVP